MSELSRSSPYRATPDAPVTEAERERLSARLNAAFEAGTVDADGYRARLDALFAASRMGDLVPVVEGLPPAPTHTTPDVVAEGPTGRPGELAPAARPGGVVVAVAAGAVVVLVLLLVLLLGLSL